MIIPILSGSMEMSQYWACAQTHPQQEQIAIRNLQRQHFHAFFPFFLANNRFRRLAVRPVFPGYVFVELDDTIPNWAPIHSTLGVKHLLTHWVSADEYRRPARIPFVGDLRRLRIRGNHSGEQDTLPPGTEVRIKRGPFAERVALVKLSTIDRVNLLLEVFSRQVSIEFDLADVVLVRRPTAALHPVVFS
jgi:transcriptional antiterminator RfaH